MVWGFPLVVLAALLSGTGSVLESRGAQKVPVARQEALGLGRLARQPSYVIGLIVDLLGFAAALAAMQFLPLFLVQAGVASSVGVTAVLASWLGLRLPSRSKAVLCGILLGLLMLAVAALPSQAVILTSAWKWAIVVGVLPVVALGWWGLHAPKALAAILLALASGLGFSLVAVAARTLDPPPSGLAALVDPSLLAIAANGVAATIGFALALERGSVTLVSTVNYTVETVLPATVGLLWLGDTVRDGFGAVAAVGFVLTVGGALLLTEFAHQAAPVHRAHTLLALPETG